MRQLTYATLCSGIEGFGRGFDAAGMECVFQCEQDRDANRVLARHYPNVSRTTDVNDDRTESELVRLRPDLLAFGFPCQDLSVAGRRAGLAGKRSGLFFRCADLIAACRPRWLCVENVPGLLSSHGGRDMGAVVGTLVDLGYGVAYRVLDAQWFGVAQRRRRVFIVGCLGDVRRAAEILFERESLPWDSPPSREAGARVAKCISGGAHPGGHNGQDDDGVIVSALDTKPYADHESKESRLVPVTFNASDYANGDFEQSNLSRPITCSPDRSRATPIVAHTLRGEDFDASEDGTGRGTPLVPVAFAQNQRDEVRNLNDCAGALAAEPGMKQQTYVAFQERGRPQGRTVESQEEIAYSLMSPKGGGRTHENNVASRSGVRRLTPRECERLMAFPDDYTRYDADGNEISDSARYRMLGNSIVTSVAEWLGRRIVAAVADGRVV